MALVISWTENRRGGGAKRNRLALMPLTMRPTGLSSPVDKDRQDFIIYSGDWAMGRVYQQRCRLLRRRSDAA